MLRARQLSLMSIGWMTVEAGVAVASGLLARSVALLGFGLDSLIELASAATILWLFTNGRGNSKTAERRAQRAIAVCFAVLALYLASDAIDTLTRTARPDMSWPGLALTASALLVMPLLARAKSQVAGGLISGATAGDAAQSWLCAIGAAATLISILANQLLGCWWADSAAALAIAGLAAYESRNTWQGNTCTDCTPIGFGEHDDCECC